MFNDVEVPNTVTESLRDEAQSFCRFFQKQFIAFDVYPLPPLSNAMEKNGQDIKIDFIFMFYDESHCETPSPLQSIGFGHIDLLLYESGQCVHPQPHTTATNIDKMHTSCLTY